MSPSLVPRLLTGLPMTTLAAAAVTCPEEEIVATQCAAPQRLSLPEPERLQQFHRL